MDSEKKEICTRINIIDKNLLKFPSNNNNTNTEVEKNIDNIFDSIHQEDFIIISKIKKNYSIGSEKYYAWNNKDELKEINEDNINIVSLSYNKNVLLFVKNNGECYLTDGVSQSVDISFKITSNKLADFASLSLKKAFKLTGNLNKKYLIKIVCGKSHIIFLTHAGMVFSLGEGGKGQLGHGDTKNLEEPTMITSLLNYRIYDVAVGADHNLALGSMRDLTKKSSTSLMSLAEISKSKEQNFIYAWGDNSKGQLGLGKELQVCPSPNLLDFFSNKKISVQKVTAGMEHSFVLSENGKLFGFGSNEFSQIVPSNDDNTFNCIYTPFRIRVKLSNQIEIKNKHKFVYLKVCSYSSLLITSKNILILNGKISSELIPNSKKYQLKCFEQNVNKTSVNIIDLINFDNSTSTASEINFILNNNSLKIIYDKSKYSILVEEINYENLELPIDENENTNNEDIINKDKFHLRLSTNTDQDANYEENYNTPNDTEFLQDFEISKEFFDNASTNELFDNNVSFEQTIEELRNYISLVGISYVGESNNSLMSFRPKNLPKKTPEEEEYHRKLVEENRKRYMKSIKEKQEEERRLKEKLDKKTLKLKKLHEIWTTEILPNWFKVKKDYNYIKKYFYEGVPISIRGRVWLLCIGNNFSITREYYEIELKKAVNILQQLQKIDKEQCTETSEPAKENNLQNKTTDTTPNNKYNIHIIDKEKSIKYIYLDIERTFPYLGIFKGNSPLGEDLSEVLQAFVASRPDIGYVQGLSYIAGMLLLYMDKYQAFVALMNITLSHNIIPFYRFEESQIRKRLQIFKQIFYHNLPELCDHFESLDILPEHYLIEWNMTLFSKNLNIDISARIWDIYMIEGIKAIYQSAIVILSHFEKKFLVSEFEVIMKTLKNTNSINFDEDQLAEMMKQVKFPEWVNQEIQKLNDEYIPIY